MRTFLLTWDGSDDGYDSEKYAADVAATSAGQEPPGRWSIRHLNVGHAAGDRVFLLRQGQDQPGIVASGRLTDGVRFERPRWNDPTRTASYAYITWEHVVALSDRLPADQLNSIPGHTWERIQNTGNEVHPPADQLLVSRWQTHLDTLGQDTGPEGSLPSWTWDETVLAYDLYLREYAEPLRYPDASHALVRNLSTLLRQLPLQPHRLRADPRFRNPAGVARKVQNLMWEATGHTSGSQHTSAMDRRVVSELRDADQVHRIAAAIDDASTQLGDRPVITLDDEQGGVEGGILLYSHRRRERDRKLVQRKKDQLLKAGRPLLCEACGVDVAGQYDLAAGAVIECHHLLPLAGGERTTRLTDLALVCPTCHRALHSRSRWGGVQELHKHFHQ